MSRILLSHFLGFVGAAIGGVAGFYAFGWLETKGFYGLAIPGSFLGLGCGLLAQHRSVPRGIVCAIAALGLSVFTEWHFHPLLADGSLGYMIKHLGDLGPVTLLMMGLATAIAFWVGQDAGFRLLPWSRPAPGVQSRPPSTGTGETA